MADGFVQLPADTRKQAYNRRYRATHRAELSAKIAAWKRAHPEQTKASNDASRARIKAECFKLLGDQCSRCTFTDPRALQVDHVNRAQVPRTSPYRAGHKLYAAIVAGRVPRSDVQLLCANCNWIKRFESGEHGA
jgi:hypothetical protein